MPLRASMQAPALPCRINTCTRCTAPCATRSSTPQNHYVGGSVAEACTTTLTIFGRLVHTLRLLRSRWKILCERRVGSSSLGPTKPKVDGVDAGGQSRSTINEQIIIPLDNVACSLYPSDNRLHDGSSSSSSQILETAIFSQSPEMLTRHQNPPTTPRILVSDDSSTYSTSSTQSLSSPTDIRRPAKSRHRILCGYPQPTYRSDSTESIERLGSGEMSRSCDLTLVTDPSYLVADPPQRLLTQERFISSPTCVEDTKIPALSLLRVYPVAPENFPRYEKRRKIPQAATTVKMSPLLKEFSDHDDIPGWSTCIHPEGGRYFHHAEKRIYTDMDLHDPVFLGRIKDVISKIDLFILEHHIKISEKTDLVIDDCFDNGRYDTYYYFADHESRLVFFLDEFSSDYLPHWSEIAGVNSGTHLRQALETQYWWHCQTYPNCIELSDDLICELRSLLVHYIADSMTSPYANSPYTLKNLEKLLAYTDSLKKNLGKPYSGCISFLSRVMYSISNTKYLNFHGQPEARLNRDQSIYGKRTNRRTLFIKSISIFLFSAPDVHLRTLQKLWVDEIMHQAVWQKSLKKVTDEWRELTLYATVLLNANVAFLAIQSVDTNRNPYRSPAQISSYCSISASVGCIILGLLLVRQNQTKHRHNVGDVQKFLKNRAHPWLGLETVAIMFSLPYALLMWGMLSFVLAFWFMCFNGSGVATRSVVATVSGIIFILISWCIWTSWEKQPLSDAQEVEDELPFERTPVKQKSLKGFEFERVGNATQQPAAASEERRQSTILSLPTILKIRKDTSRTMVEREESVDEKGKSCCNTLSSIVL